MKSLPIVTALVVIECCFIFVSSQLGAFDYGDYKKYLKKQQKKETPSDKPHKHKNTEEFVKKLEYNVNIKEGSNPLDFGLTPVDLNLLQDEEFAEDLVDGVEEELTVIDQEFGESENSSLATIEDKSSVIGPISLMHQGMYTPSPEYNLLIDGLIRNVQQDLKKREMDPLYFGIHNRGIVRHTTKTKAFNQDQLQNMSAKLSENPNKNETDKSMVPLGVGIIEGLLKLKRFGNAESRKDGDVTLIRSHYFFGPLKIDLLFGSVRGIHILNTTLSSLAAHALLEVSNDNSTILKEFITDSPMEYEIRLRGTKNRRFRRLSESSISRLFKRGGRMEKRLERSFQRGLRKPIQDVVEKNKKNKKDNNEIEKKRLEPRRKL